MDEKSLFTRFWADESKTTAKVLAAVPDSGRNYKPDAKSRSAWDLATHLGCDVKVVNRIVNGRTSVTAEMALKLAATFRTSPEMWLNAQKAVDLYEALGHLRRLPKPLLAAG